MKNRALIFLSILLIVGCVSCNKNPVSTEAPQFDPEGQSYIRVINEAKDSVEVAKFYSTLLGKPIPNQWSTKIAPSTDTVLSMNIGIHQVSSINVQRNLVSLFLAPQDTTIIHVTKVNRSFTDLQHKYGQSGENNVDLFFEGTYAMENHYLQLRDISFSMRFTAELANDPRLSLTTFAYKIDSLAESEKNFLDSLNRQLQLDRFFLDVEHASIYYSSSEKKIKHPSFLSFQLGEMPTVPDGYYKFIEDIDLSHPGSAYANNFYYLASSLVYHNVIRYWGERIEGYEEQTRQEQISMLYQYLKTQFETNDFDPFQTDSLIEATKVKAKVDQYSALQDQISPEVFELLIYNRANMDASFLNSKLGEIASVIYKSEFPDNPYLELVNYKKGLQKGDPAPYFYLKSWTGDFVELEKFTGKLIYLNFWAPWCKPCMAELPAEKMLAKTIASDSVEIVNICVYCDEKDWKKTVEEKDMPGTHLFAQGEWTEQLTEGFQNMGIPHYSLIDMEGRIIANPTYRPSDPQLVEFIRSNLPDYGLLK